MVREARGARAPPSRGGRRPPRSSCRPCRSAASPSSTAQTPTLKCRPSPCPETARSPVRGKILTLSPLYHVATPSHLNISDVCGFTSFEQQESQVHPIQHNTSTLAVVIYSFSYTKHGLQI